jgi:hypothetical protein
MRTTLRRPLLAAVTCLALAAPIVALTVPASAAALPTVVINEVESNGDATDWVEIMNTGTETVDVSGWVIKDNDDTRTLAIPAGTSLAAGAYLAVDVDVKATAGNFGRRTPTSPTGATPTAPALSPRPRSPRRAPPTRSSSPR